MDRRAFLANGIAGLSALGAAACVPPEASEAGRLPAALRLVEVSTGGRFGVAIHDPAAGRTIAHNGTERFALASTFKLSLAALALAQQHAGRIDLDERTRWSEADFVPYRPFTEPRTASGATWRELARAAQTLSDNVAANLLLKRLGGPEALTAFWRSIGDGESRLDRFEPELNRVPPGDLRDTTTPAAMAQTVHTLAFAGPLSPANRAQLRDWMVATETGLERVRAGLPNGWEAGDKTGSSGNWPDAPYVRGDIGFVIGPRGQPLTFAAYHRSPLIEPIAAARVDAGFAAIGRLLADYIRRSPVTPGV